jgi:hypothetical protein
MHRLAVRTRALAFVALTLIAALSVQAGQRWFH